MKENQFNSDILYDAFYNYCFDNKEQNIESIIDKYYNEIKDKKPLPVKTDKLFIYTDGACSPNPGTGGWACIIIGSNKIVKKSGFELETTNQRMEITSVLEALKLLIGSYTIELFTDSMYVINTATKWLDNWIRNNDSSKANMDLWRTYKQLSKNHKITFHHVKGHSGNSYNEECDQLAVKARVDRQGIFTVV